MSALRLLPLYVFVAAAVHGVAASGQALSTRPLRILTSQPGGGTDFVTRLIAQGLTERLGQQVIVENRPSGVVIGETVARAAPDGHTLFLNGSAFWLQPLLQSGTPYDPVKDFSPILLATRSPNLVVVHPSLPVQSVAALVKLARARPGELNYGSSSAGTPTHLGAELFKSMASVNIVRVPYKGNGPALNALLAGEVHVMFANVAAVSPHVQAGRLRALAVASSEPTRLAPGLPTVAAAGLAGYESTSVYGVFGPARMPRELVMRLNQEIARVLNAPDINKRLFAAGMEVPAGSPEQLAEVMASDVAKIGPIIRRAGIRADY